MSFYPVKISFYDRKSHDSLKWAVGSILKNTGTKYTYYKISELAGKLSGGTVISAINCLLGHWGIKSQINNIPEFTPATQQRDESNDEQLAPLIKLAESKIVLTFMRFGLQEFGPAFIKANTDKSITLYAQKSTKTITYDEFKKMFMGEYLHWEATENVGEPNLRLNRIEYYHRWLAGFVFPLALVALLIGLPVVNHINTTPVLPLLPIFGVLIAGFGVAIGLLLHNINPLQFERLCQKSLKVNCAQVLTSPQSRVFGVALVDLCLTFYGGCLLLLGVIPSTQVLDAIFILFALHVISVPITIYSIYLQKVEIKKWCTLCLYTVALLWLGLGALIWPLSSLAIPSVSNLALASLSFAVVFGVIFIIRNLFKRYGMAYTESFDAKNYLNNPFTAKMILDSVKTAQLFETDMGRIFLGNPKAKNSCILIVGIDCHKCSYEISSLKHAISAYADKYTFEVIFGHPHDTENMVLSDMLLELALANQHEAAKELLLLWYSRFLKNPFLTAKAFMDELGLPIKEYKNGRFCFEQYFNWCMANRAHATPAVVINGKLLPAAIYDIDHVLLNGLGANEGA